MKHYRTTSRKTSGGEVVIVLEFLPEGLTMTQISVIVQAALAKINAPQPAVPPLVGDNDDIVSLNSLAQSTGTGTLTTSNIGVTIPPAVTSPPQGA